MNASVTALNIDRDGNIWIGTETGLFHYDKSLNTVKRFDAREGLLNDSYTSIASDRVSHVYAGGPAGLSVIDLGGHARYQFCPAHSHNCRKVP